MSIDARGGLWLDNPLLVLGLLSVLWVLIAWLHTCDRRRHAGVSERVHLNELRQTHRVAGVVRVANPIQSSAGLHLDGGDAGALALARFLANEWECQPRELGQREVREQPRPARRSCR